MAIPGSNQPLIAAFIFGILFNTASAGFILYLRGHGSAIFRDGLRLALIIFLATSGLWALVGFISTLLAPTDLSQCQIAVIFSSLFDQVARTAIQQSLVWAVAKEGSTSTLGKIQQLQVLARFVVGMVFVGETGPQFNSTCVPNSKLVPVAIVIIAMDAALLVVLAIRALSSDNQDPDKRKAILLTTTALAVWMGTSVTLLLGLRTIDFLLRTTIPAVGLFILVALVTLFVGVLGAGTESRQRPPVSPTPQNYNRNRDISTADTDDYPPSRYAEVKGIETTVTTYSNEAAWKDQNALPPIARPITGVIGFDGVPVQGQLFPPMRPQEEVQPRQMPPQKLIDVKTQNNKSKKGVGKLVISNPIPAATPGMQDALNKIPTIDLATAWKNESERRAMSNQVRNPSPLIASRPAPRPPQNGSNGESGGLQNVSGKDGYPIEMLQSTQNAPQSDEALSVGGNASSSSGVQLSPGNEESLRRRSPRQTTAPVKTPNIIPPTAGKPVRIPIPRPRPPPEEENKEKEPEPVKTPLQRRPTTGLPSNPRAKSLRRVSDEDKEGKDKGQARQETVMFINNIIYDDPNYVNDIIEGASKTNPRPNSGDSQSTIMERPRPIRRMSDTDRQVFPAETLHRRSRSNGSIASRKSMLRSVPGSPTELPPLPPPPPKSAGLPSRPHPNDTKSMTFDEKMVLLYPPSTTTSPAEAPRDMKRKSSVPSLPPLPLAFQDGRLAPRAEAGIKTIRDFDDDKRNTSYTEDMPGDDDGANQRSPQNNARNEGTKRSSSPVLPATKFSRASIASEAKTQFSTNWGSVHSPVAPIDIQQARVCPRETYIKTQGRPPIPSAISGIGEEVVTVMLDTSSEGSADRRRSVSLEDERPKTPEEKSPEVPEVPKAEEAPSPSQWHRRVGDEYLSFSERKDKVRSRLMPPPPPLLLNGIGKKKAIVMPAPEPSPLESPQAALQVIQAQLKKFEEPNRDSVESTGRRIALLENLEEEMGMQENRWHSMQNSINRDSVSTVQDSPVPPVKQSQPAQPESTTESSVSRPSSARSMIAERRASRRARMASISSVSHSREQSTEMPPPSETSDGRKSTLFQVRLAEAQSQYMEHSNDLIQKRNNLNFLSVSQSADLGSPTPPDTDESESELPGISRDLATQPVVEVNYLWAPSPQQPDQPSNQLWISPLPKEGKEMSFPELPGLTVRPALRKPTEAPLQIESIRLWQKPVKPTSSQVGGLWTKYPRQPSKSRKVMARPTTNRPPRRTRRITALPDIIESPKPLPEKRGTLGIFQFPWGQKSDNATIPVVPQVQPRTLVAMPGTMASRGPRTMPGTMSSGGVRPRATPEGSEGEEAGYSSSFFDDYDEEDSGDNLNDDDYYDSGDDFDETTLWEIASLLKTDEQLPGRESLGLPTMGGAALNEYESEMSPDFERMYDEEYSGMDAVPDDSDAVQDMWAPKATDSTGHQLGLPQPDEDTWARYNPADVDTVRPKSRVVEVAPIESGNLWGSLLLASSEAEPSVAKATTWVPTANERPPSFGLPQPTQWVGFFPAESAPPKRNTLRFDDGELELESTDLWSPTGTDFQMDDSESLWDEDVRQSYRQSRSSGLWAPDARQSLRQSYRQSRSSGLWTPDARQSLRQSYRQSYRQSLRQSRGVSMLSVSQVAPVAESIPEEAVNTLWTASSSSSSPSYGLPQPAASVWASYIPSDVGMIRTQSRKEEIQPIQSTKLWSLEETIPETQGLWSKPSVQEQPTFGLPQPDAAVWQNYHPQQTETVRPQPRFEEMPSIESYNLWVPQEMQFASSTGLLWSESVESAALLSLVPASTAASLWDPPVAPVASSETEGLFDASAPRVDYRRTSKLPAAISMTTKPRVSNEPLPQLTSHQLWVAPQSTVVSNDEPSLWAPSSGFATLPVSSAGLFKLDSERTIWRTTDAEPAALHMTRKPRQIIAPIATLESSRMWSPGANTAVEHDWITISTIRPRSPSLASVASANSTVSSPVTDTSSVHTTATKASTAPSVAESSRSGFSLRGWIGRKRNSDPELPKVPEQPNLPNVPEIPEEFVVRNLDEELVIKNLDEELVIKNLDEELVIKNLDEELVIKDLDAAPSTKPVQDPARYQHRQSMGSPADWDAALSEAINASYPNTRFALVHASESQWNEALQAAIMAGRTTTRVKRSNSSPKEWSQALNEAIAASYPDKRFSRGQIPYSQWETELREAIARSKRYAAFDASSRHPVFMASSLLTNAQDVHPAAIGYTYDVASKHPVFFGSATSTTSLTAHPAMPRKSRPFTAPRPVSRGSRVAALTQRISFLNESARPSSVVGPRPPKVPVMPKAVATFVPPPQESSMLWSESESEFAQPATQASQEMMWTAPAGQAMTPGVPSLEAPISERPQRMSSKPSGAIEVNADFDAQEMWQSAPYTESSSKNWLQG